MRDIVAQLCTELGHSFTESVIAVDERPGQDAAYVIDSTLARTELGWQPEISLADGLKEVINWVQSNLAAIRQSPLSYKHKP